MRILFDHALPFALAQGGVQVQIERSKAALESLGVRVDWFRWWDASQAGDLIHYFGVPSPGYLRQARLKRIPVVVTTWFSETCNRSPARLAMQRWLTQTILALPAGEGIKGQLNWRAYQGSDHLVVGLQAERSVLESIYRVEPSRISVVALGLPEAFAAARPASRSSDHLLCVGTITDVKGQVELADLACRAEVPVLFVGNPYHLDSPYWSQFKARIDSCWVRHQPHIGDERELIKIYQSARGFVMLSRYENWCLAASEAAACGLPLLLPDLPWSRERFGGAARYFPTGRTARVAALREFHQSAGRIPPPPVAHLSWGEVARQLHETYLRVLRNSV